MNTSFHVYSTNLELDTFVRAEEFLSRFHKCTWLGFFGREEMTYRFMREVDSDRDCYISTLFRARLNFID